MLRFVEVADYLDTKVLRSSVAPEKTTSYGVGTNWEFAALYLKGLGIRLVGWQTLSESKLAKNSTQFVLNCQEKVTSFPLLYCDEY